MIVAAIRELFANGGENLYFGEAVTQREHALQAAHLAERHGASDALVVAALLHDIGHLLHLRERMLRTEGSTCVTRRSANDG